MNYNKIKFYLSKNKMTIKDLATAIDMTEAGFHACFKNETLSVKKMELIAEILKIHPCELFTDEKSFQMLSAVAESAPHYGATIPEYSQKIIETQNKVIDLLTSELERRPSRLRPSKQ